LDELQLTPNETIIVTLLAANGPMSKQQLQQKGGMGWATVVKMIDRLESHGIVTKAGTLQEPDRGRGKRAYVYDVSEQFPRAVGVDVEYEVTTLALTNLKGESSHVHRVKTPRHPTHEEMRDFLTETVTGYLAANAAVREQVVGVGIGVPRLELPSRDRRKGVVSAGCLARALSEVIHLPVAIDGNVWVYTLYEKWTNRPFTADDFFLLSVRGGLGLGIYLRNGLLEGRQGYPGAVAHYKVIPDGKLCRCGRRGCVETVFNEYHFFEAYLTRVLEAPVPPPDATTQTDIVGAAQALCNAAERGDARAVEVLEESARALSLALAPLIAGLNVPLVIFSGHFGSGGRFLVSLLEKHVRERILPQLNFRMAYYPLDDLGFTVGAALLVLNRFFSPPNSFWVAKQIQND
jgi:predicted NBD/HSP70 family sugar kinase